MIAWEYYNFLIITPFNISFVKEIKLLLIYIIEVYDLVRLREMVHLRAFSLLLCLNY